MENGESKDSTTVITSHGSEFGEDSLIIDGVLNLGIGNHFGIFLNVDGYRQTTYLTPYTETVTKGKYGLISGSSSVNSTGISTGCNGDFFGINFNFNKNDFFLKAIGGFYSESPGYVRVWDAENDTTTREVETFGPRFDLGFEISKENTNHEVDLSFYTGKMDMGSYEQSFSKIWLKGDYIYSHIFENSSIFSIYGGLDFTSAEHSMFSGDNSIKTISLIPSVKLALKYPVVQDKLFLSLGASGNISGFTRSVGTVISRASYSENTNEEVVTTTKSVVMDRVPVQTAFYGGLIFDITDSFTVKTSIDLGAKDVTSGVLDYSFAVQGTYKF